MFYKEIRISVKGKFCKQSMENTEENFKVGMVEKGHILVVDDDQRIRELVSRYLNAHDFIALAAKDAGEARAMLEVFEVDAAVVDVMMPGESGLDLTQHIQDSAGVPVILLTALGETQDRLNGFEAGADDYLPKPFEPMELVMRLQAIIRRTRKPASGMQKPVIGGWVFEEDLAGLSREDAFLKLTSIEMNLMKALLEETGKPVSRERLCELCGIDVGSRAVDVQVTRLRKKLEKDTKNPRYLQTVRGKGYVLYTD